VLGHGHPAPGHDKGRRGRDVEGLETVATGTAGVYHRRRGRLNTVGFFAHGPCGAGQFFNGLSLGGQGRHHGTHLGIGGLAVKNFRHHLRHLGLAQVGSADNGCQVRFEHGWVPPFYF
jgi:hypothetical protein